MFINKDPKFYTLLEIPLKKRHKIDIKKIEILVHYYF